MPFLTHTEKFAVVEPDQFGLLKCERSMEINEYLQALARILDATENLLGFRIEMLRDARHQLSENLLFAREVPIHRWP